MGDNVFVNARRDAIVDEIGPGKKWQISRKEAVRLGLLESDEPAKPQARRNAPQDTTRLVNEPRVDTAREFNTSGPVASAPKKAARK